MEEVFWWGWEILDQCFDKISFVLNQESVILGALSLYIAEVALPN
jgi:hypothetical protein